MHCFLAVWEFHAVHCGSSGWSPSLEMLSNARKAFCVLQQHRLVRYVIPKGTYVYLDVLVVNAFMLDAPLLMPCGPCVQGGKQLLMPEGSRNACSNRTRCRMHKGGAASPMESSAQSFSGAFVVCLLMGGLELGKRLGSTIWLPPLQALASSGAGALAAGPQSQR